MKNSVAAIPVALLTLLGVPHAVAADLLETAGTSGGAKVFVAAIKEAGITDSLKTSGPYTVFAPADSAFNKLTPEDRNALLKDKKKLAQVLSHHVVPGKIMVSDVKPGRVQTLQGGAITLRSDNGKVTVDDANVTESDVTADNGVIHIIDTLVLPK